MSNTTTTTTTQKLSFNSLPIHNLTNFSSLQVPDIHLVEHESMKELSPEIDIDNITDLSATLCSAQQPPLLCPGLIRNCPVPPPVQMQWQLTVPSESELEDYNIGSLSSMDREREITLSPDDHIDNISESNFSFLPNIHQLSNSSSYHSNHSNMSSLSMTSLHSLSSYNPSSSCSTTTEWISNEYDNNYQPQIPQIHHSHHPLSMPALSLIPSPSGHIHTNTPNTNINTKQDLENKSNDSDDIDNDNNKFHTNKDMIFETLCQFEDGSMSQMISAVDDDNNNNDGHSQSSKLQQSQSQCAISTKYETKYQHLMNGFIRNLEKEIKQIIPNDINKICQEFYYEKEQKYIHLTYTIHECHQQIITNKDNKELSQNDDEQTPTFHNRPWQKNTFSGKELIEMMDIDINVADQTQFGSITMEEICDHLIQYGLIECVSYKTHFSALFANNNSNSMSSSILNWDRNQFKASHDYLYNFTQNALSAIKQFNHSQLS